MKKILLTICAPNKDEAKKWGDYYFALSLGEEFKKYSYDYKISAMDEWSSEGNTYDIHLHLRGLRKYPFKKKAKVNVIWHISHPESISLDEYYDFDLIFVASLKLAKVLQDLVKKPLYPLLQASNPKFFFYQNDKKFRNDLIFIGNTKGFYREVVKFAVDAGFSLKIWGKGWQKYIDTKYLEAEFFPNNQLRLLYSSAKIVLNDHWSDMSENGFISNRIFDVLASGGFVITDYVRGIEEVFGKTVICYYTALDFKEKVFYYLNCEGERKELSENGRNLILRNHTFAHRVEFIIDKINKET